MGQNWLKHGHVQTDKKRLIRDRMKQDQAWRDRARQAKPENIRSRRGQNRVTRD